MSDLDALDDLGEPEDLGPVDYVVVELPGDRILGAIAPQLDDLVDQGLIRVLDMVVVRRHADGEVETIEVRDLRDHGARRHAHESSLAMLLGAQDIATIAAVVEPGCTAGIVVWENRWAVPFARSVRTSGGQLVAGGRITVDALLAGVQEAEGRGAPDLGRASSHRSPHVAVLGSGPLSRTADSPAVATAVARAVERRTG